MSMLRMGWDLERDEPMRRISLLLPLTFTVLFDIEFVMVRKQSVRATRGDVVSSW